MIQRLLFTTLVFVSTSVSAHAGHEVAGSAPKGPFQVVKKDKVFLSCQADPSSDHSVEHSVQQPPPKSAAVLQFETPYTRLTLHQLSGYKVNYSILLGLYTSAVQVGDVLTAPKLVTENCDQPFQIRCDKRGQPVALQYRGSQKDVFCAGRFNFIIEFDRDFGPKSPAAQLKGSN